MKTRERHEKMARGQTLSLRTAWDLKDAGRLEEAEDLCQKILKNSPEDAAASHLLGCISYEVGRLGPAAQLIGISVDTDPENSTYKLDLGRVFLDMGRIDDAEELLGAVVDKKPDNALALLLLGHALFRQGKQDAAYEKWQLHLSLRCKSLMDSEQNAVDDEVIAGGELSPPEEQDQPEHDAGGERGAPGPGGGTHEPESECGEKEERRPHEACSPDPAMTLRKPVR